MITFLLSNVQKLSEAEAPPESIMFGAAQVVLHVNLCALALLSSLLPPHVVVLGLQVLPVVVEPVYERPGGPLVLVGGGRLGAEGQAALGLETKLKKVNGGFMRVDVLYFYKEKSTKFSFQKSKLFYSSKAYKGCFLL